MEVDLKYGLKEKVIDEIRNVLSANPQVEKAVLYGSRAKGTYRVGSDIDLCLFGGNLNLSVQFKIENDLDELLLPYKIDISLFHNISNADLTEHIQHMGVVFYQR